MKNRILFASPLKNGLLQWRQYCLPGISNGARTSRTMKIRTPRPEEQGKVAALLRQAFPGSSHEEQLVADLHAHGRTVHEWVCIHTNQVVAYIAFSNAYHGSAVCGLHLAPLAVKPEFQGQGVGSELLRFALRQEAIRDTPLFVLGDPDFYRKFGFAPCATPVCPFDPGNAHFLGLRNAETVTNHGVSPQRSNNHGISGHREPQVVASGTAMRTFVREPDRSPQDVVPCDRLPETSRFTVGYEAEFTPGSGKGWGGKARKRRRGK
jgi:putative acetyltransferase